MMPGILESLGFGAPQPDPMQAQQAPQPGLGSRINSGIADNSGRLIGLGTGLMAHRQDASNPMFNADALMLGQQMDEKRKKEREEKEKERRGRAAAIQSMIGLGYTEEQANNIIDVHPDFAMKALEKKHLSEPEKPPEAIRTLQHLEDNPDLWESYERMKAASRSQTNIDARNMGNVPPGWELVEEPGPDGAMRRTMRPIPGGPAEAEMEAGESERATAQESQASIAGFTLRDARVAKEDIPKMADNAVVRLGKAKLPGTSEYRTAQFYDSLRGTIAIEQLLNIKRQGSGLGQVPQSQLDMLSFLMGKLDMGLPKEDQKMIVEDIQQRYKEILARMTPEDRAMVGIAEREYNALTGQGGGGGSGGYKILKVE